MVESLVRSPSSYFQGWVVLERANWPCNLRRDTGKGIFTSQNKKVPAECSSRFWAVWWIDCSTLASAQDGFGKVAEACYIKFKDPSMAVDAVKDYLANCRFHWLLVLDNCDDTGVDYGQYMPSGLRGAVMMTSRLGDSWRYATGDNKKHLTGLPLPLASDLVLKAAQMEQPYWETMRSAADAMATILGQHPLAILLGGAYVSERLCSLEEYPEMFKRQSSELLSVKARQVPADYDTVYATFEISYRHLQKSTEASSAYALCLLRTVTSFDRQAVSEGIFMRAWSHSLEVIEREEDNSESITTLSWWHAAEADKFCDETSLEDRLIYFRVARSTLCKLSLATFDADPESFSLHPLVHAWAKSRQTPEERIESWCTAASIIALSTKEYRFFATHSFNSLQVARHIESCLDAYLDQTRLNTRASKSPQVEVLRILYCCIYQLLVSRSNGIPQWGQVLIDETTAFTDASPGCIMAAKYLCARCVLGEGTGNRSVEMLEQVAEYENSLPVDHPDRLATQHWLACAYLNSGRYREAVRLLENVVSIETGLPVDDPNRLISQYYLARAYMREGRNQEAMEIFEQVERAEFVLPENDPDRLLTQVQLARSLLANGQICMAISMLEATVQIMSETYPFDHPDRISAEESLANAYSVGGQHMEAVKLLEKTFNIRATTLPPENLDRLTSQHNLASAYIASKQKVRVAQTLLEEVLKIQAVLHSPEHPSYLESQHELACAYFVDGNHVKAAEILEEVIAGRKVTLGAEHPNCTNSMELLALIYDTEGCNTMCEKSQRDVAGSLIQMPTYKDAESVILENIPDRKQAPSRSASRAFRSALVGRMTLRWTRRR